MAKTDSWYMERIIWLVAGIFILISLTFAYFFSKYWLILAALVGVNLIILSLTGYCLMANILDKFGVKPLYLFFKK